MRRIALGVCLAACGLVALVATLWLALIVLTLASAPECVAKDGAARAAHWLVYLLTIAVVAALWVGAAARLRPAAGAAAVLLLVVPATVVVSVGVADVVATSWSGGEVDAAPCM